MEAVTPTETPSPGASMFGGFYAGTIVLAGARHAVIVSPRALGDLNKVAWIRSSKAILGATSYCDGLANTEAMANADSSLAKSVRKLRIAGFDDWYLPSRDELELIYRYLKPGTHVRRALRCGDNPSSEPVGYPYTEAITQTVVEAFRAGGSEALVDDWYWTSTQFTSDASSAWYQHFSNGDQRSSHQNDKLRARAVRRVKL